MRGLRYDRILAGTAMALVLAVAGNAYAASPRPAPQVATDAPAGTWPPHPPPADATMHGCSRRPSPATSTDASPAKPLLRLQAARHRPRRPAPAARLPRPPRRTEAAAPDPFASLDPADRPIAEKIRDLAGRQDRQDFRQQERARRGRDVLSEPQHGAALARQGHRERARQGRGRAHPGGRCGRPRPRAITRSRISPRRRSDALAEAELKFTETVLTYRAPRAGRPLQLFGDQQEHRAAAAAARHRRGARPSSPTPGCRQGARRVQPAAEGLPGPQGRSSPELRDKAGGGSNEIARRTRAQAHQGPDGGSARAAIARAARRRGRCVRPALRCQARRCGEEVPAQPTSSRPPARSTRATIRELNGPPRDKQIDTIIANMERWRWYPRDLGKTHVMVNSAGVSRCG